MRLLFVSSTTVGGSGRSQRELAAQLRDRGHEIRFLVDDGRPSRLTRAVYEQLSDLRARAEGTVVQRPVRALERRPGRRTRTVELDGWTHRATPIPQNALGTLIDEFRPDVVVGNSLERLAWRRVHEACRERCVKTVLYVRETDSLDHFVHGEVPDLLIANAASLQAALRERGLDCEFVPSVVESSVTSTESTRRVVLAVNPVASRGGDIIWKVASSAPEIPFVVQESWPLEAAVLADVERRAAELPNVEFRRAAPPGPQLYGDARVLMVPYRVDNRPRVIAEAQSNGIPVVAADVPALREAIGMGGAVVELDAIDAWVDELRSLWGDAARYERLVAAAFEHSRRPDIDPTAVTGRFERLVEELLDGRHGAP